jgi:glycosyltransferase involved in cell wall biosynthesis
MTLPCPLRAVTQAHAGLAAARNAGIRVARGQVVLFIDDDTLADPALLAGHWRSHREHPGSVVVGGVRHVHSPDDPPGRVRRLADLSTSFFWTTNASVGRDELFGAGLFDEAFVEYGWEDLEFGDRLRQRGLRRCRNPRAIVRHVKPPLRTKDVPALISRAEASGRSAVLYVRKRPTLRARMATGITPVRRRVARWLSRAEHSLEAATSHGGEGPLGPAARTSAYLLETIHYYRAIERTLART